MREREFLMPGRLLTDHVRIGTTSAIVTAK